MLEGASNSIYFAIQSNCTATHSNSESKLQLEARSNSKPGVALGFVNQPVNTVKSRAEARRD